MNIKFSNTKTVVKCNRWAQTVLLQLRIMDILARDNAEQTTSFNGSTGASIMPKNIHFPTKVRAPPLKRTKERGANLYSSLLFLPLPINTEWVLTKYYILSRHEHPKPLLKVVGRCKAIAP